MPTLATDDDVKLHYEESGSGTPIVFVHEFGGDYRSWEPQVRHFSRRYRCVTYNARGYPPSDVPEDYERYSQARARDDIRCVLDALGLQRAHVVGLSMGAFATLHFGMTYGYRALSITVAGGGYGSHPAQYRQFQADSKKNAELIKREGMAHFVETYGRGPQRVQLEIKDARAHEADAARHHDEHPQGPVAVQPADGDPRAARGTKRPRAGPGVPAGSAGAERAPCAALRVLAERAAARVPGAGRLGACLRPQPGASFRALRQRRVVALSDRVHGDLGHIEPPLRAPRVAALRPCRAGLGAQSALRVCAPVAARARSPAPDQCDRRAPRRGGIARPAHCPGGRFQRLAPARHAGAGRAARAAGSDLGLRRSPRTYLPERAPGAAPVPYLRARLHRRGGDRKSTRLNS